MKQAIVELAHQLNGKFKALTVDHGKEFADFRTIEDLTGTPVYFAMPTHHMNVVVTKTIIGSYDALYSRESRLKS